MWHKPTPLGEVFVPAWPERFNRLIVAAKGPLMMRSVLALLTFVGVVVILSYSPLPAEGGGDKGGKTGGKKGGHPQDAIIVTVDTAKHEITVTIHEEKGGKKEEKGGKKEDKEGKKGKPKHYHLTQEVKIVDASGKVTTLEVFKKGDRVKIVEVEGKIHELHHQGAASKK
jgi:hypothetical protein